MINITFIVPYPELKETVNRVFNEHPQRSLLNADIRAITPDKLSRRTLECDVVVARGYAVDRIKAFSIDVPCVTLGVDILDIIDAIEECIAQYNPKKIGLLWSHYITQGIDKLCTLFNCEVVPHKTSESTLESTLKKAAADGCDAFIGGYTLGRMAKQYGYHYTITKTGEKTITQAVNEAIRTVQVIKKERESAEAFKTIIQCSKEGILYIDAENKIRTVNSQAKLMCDSKNKSCEGIPVGEAFPYMTKCVSEVLLTGEEKRNELHRVGQIMISATYTPVFVEDKAVGVVVNFQNVTDIQFAEAQIRKKLNAKGHSARYNFEDIVGSSGSMKKTIETARKFAEVSSNILLVGETGTGKELMAQSIHNESRRKNGPFVAVNCAALPENLLESELFGYVDGAFTGAARGGKMGLFELAHNGTLFLDEISEIPLSFQGKLLRVLQEREVRRIGDDKVVFVDIRIIAATNRDLRMLVREGKFREDLLYRLDVLKLHIPPIRKRTDDIADIFMYYTGYYQKRLGLPQMTITNDAVLELSSYEFRGNVRELRNIAERVSVMNRSGTITRAEIREALFPDCDAEEEEEKTGEQSLKTKSEENERQLIERALSLSGLSRADAAELLGISRSTLWRKLKKHNLSD